ncbi:MAG TPA: putative Ig domain-containing protein, partial [Fibrella sp.]
MNFVATDNNLTQANTIVNIVVSEKPQFVSPTLGNNSAICVTPGQTKTATYQANDPDPLDQVTLSVVSGSAPGMVFTPSAPANPGTATFSWTPTAAEWGVYHFKVRATDSYNDFIDNTVHYVVNDPPTITSTPVTTVFAGQAYSYTVVGDDPNIPQGDELEIESSSLPSFLSVVDNHDNTFTISGTAPTTPGTFPVMIELEDEVGHSNGVHCGSTAQSFSLQVVPCTYAPTITASHTGNQCPGTPVTLTSSPADSYLWSTNETTQSITVIASGTTNYTVTAASGFCTGTTAATVTGSDNQAPVPNVAALSTATGECSVTVTVPIATDNCAGTITATTTDPTVYNAQGTYSITWSYNDGNGNTSTQVQSVVVDDVTAPVASISTLPTVSGECSATITTAPTAIDNCGSIITGTTTNPLSYNVQGTYTVEWTYNDDRGNISTQNQTVVVDDNTVPTITCAGPVSAFAAVGQCIANVTVAAPTAHDNCSFFGAAPEMVINGGFMSGANSWNHCSNGVEVNPVNAYGGSGSNPTAEVDAHFNLASAADDRTLCQNISGFTIGKTYTLSFKASRRTNGAAATVGTNVMLDGGALNTNVFRSNTAFALTPETFTFTATQTTHKLTFKTTSQWTPGSYGIIIDDISIKLQSQGTITNNHTGTADASGTYLVGTTTVTWTATDAAGNEATCTQNVTVTDNQAPVITTNGNKSVNNAVDACGALVTVSATASDNCSVGAPV